MQPESLQLLVTRTMPYGKYKGRLIADLPGNYLNWFAREGFPPGEIGRLLALMHELDHNGLSALLDPLRQRQGVSRLCVAVRWSDFDPSNDVLPSTRHVRLAWGRDFGDVSPLRGVILGGGEHALKVAVMLTPWDNA